MTHMPRRRFLSTLTAGAAGLGAGFVPPRLGAPPAAAAKTGSRFAYLQERDPYYPGLHFPKLTTPMWVGEPGVDAVVLFSADDLGVQKATGPTPLYPYHALKDLHPQVYYDSVRDIARRLRQIDGRSPITFFANRIDPADPLLQRMLQEGYSIDAHTLTHPVPLMRTDSHQPASPASLVPVVRDFLECLSNISQVPGNRPVAFRTPGFDARNTTSPRFFSEVFPQLTAEGRFLQADSSIFTVYTSEDSGLPRELVRHPDGRERFAKYLDGMPNCRGYSNYVVNYPYPWVVDRLIWELPPMMPADSNGLHLHKPDNPLTVEDLKRALDLTVHKQGLMVICFHPEVPHEYISGDLLGQLVDHAVQRYGKRVKFLNAREICDRITENLLDGHALRSATGADNGVRLADINGDGYLDVLIGNSRTRKTKIWQPEKGAWRVTSLPVPLVTGEDRPQSLPSGAQVFTASAAGQAGLIISTPEQHGMWRFNGNEWQAAGWTLPREVNGQPLYTVLEGVDRGVRLRDLDGDGLSDLILNNESQNTVFFQRGGDRWEEAPFRLPRGGALVDARGIDQGLRFVDIDGDGFDDLILSNDQECWVYLYENPQKGWSRHLLQGLAGEIPPIVSQGAVNGVWFHTGALVHANEFTQRGECGWMTRLSFQDLLARAKGRTETSSPGPLSR